MVPCQQHWGWRSENGQFIFSLSDKPSVTSRDELARQNTRITYISVIAKRQQDGQLDVAYKAKDRPFSSDCCQMREHFSACPDHRHFFLVYLHGDLPTDAEFYKLMDDVEKSLKG